MEVELLDVLPLMPPLAPVVVSVVLLLLELGGVDGVVAEDEEEEPGLVLLEGGTFTVVELLLELPGVTAVSPDCGSGARSLSLRLQPARAAAPITSAAVRRRG